MAKSRPALGKIATYEKLTTGVLKALKAPPKPYFKRPEKSFIL